MRKGGLSSRLSALKAGRDEAEKKQIPSRPSSSASGAGAGRPVYAEKNLLLPGTFPGWTRLSEFLYEKRTLYPSLSPPAAGTVLKKVYSNDLSRKLLFFDLETTGLSGGAGNIAFLAGVGRYGNKGFEVRQIFLSDYPGEPEFLQHLKSLMSEEEIWVSYNGKSFDSSLLRTRFLMNREQPLVSEHLDLLYPSRRLWRTILPDCSLGTIEKSILGKERRLDIPGSQIPDIYFSFLRSREPDMLDRVFAHHAEDIASLLLLYNLLAELFEEPYRPAGSLSLDKAGLGALLLRGEIPSWEKVLNQGFSEGQRRCGFILSGVLKRAKRFNEAFDIWTQMWEEEPEPVVGIEMAKELEHRRGEYRMALEIIETLFSEKHRRSGDEKLFKALEHRAERLRRKGDI